MINGWEYDGEPEDLGLIREPRGQAGIRSVTAILHLSRTIGPGEAAEAAGADVAVADVLRAAGLGARVFDSADATDDAEATIGGLVADTVSVEMAGLIAGSYDARATVRVSAVVRAERSAILKGRELIGAAVEALS